MDMIAEARNALRKGKIGKSLSSGSLGGSGSRSPAGSSVVSGSTGVGSSGRKRKLSVKGKRKGGPPSEGGDSASLGREEAREESG